MKTTSFQSVDSTVLTLIVLTCLAFFMSACDADSQKENHGENYPFPMDNSERTATDVHYDSSMTALDVLKKDESAVVYGTVINVEPVLDLFHRVKVNDEWVHFTECDADVISAALRVRLRVEEASWPVDEDETVVLGLHTQRMHAPVPEIRNDRAAVSWSDGQGYFAKGARFGAVGKFDTSGIFIPDIPFFSVDAKGNVVLPKGHEKEPELSGQNLNGLVSGLEMSRDEVFQEHVNDAWGELTSACKGK